MSKNTMQSMNNIDWVQTRYWSCYILIFSSVTTGPIWTKLDNYWPWVAPIINCIQSAQIPSKMAAVTKKRNFKSTITIRIFNWVIITTLFINVSIQTELKLKNRSQGGLVQTRFTAFTQYYIYQNHLYFIFNSVIIMLLKCFWWIVGGHVFFLKLL
jgi:hypothetical protein